MYGSGTPTDQATTIFFQAGVLPGTKTLQLQDPLRIRGLTVQNNSTCPISIYINRQPLNANAPADLVVPAATANNIPIASAQYIIVGFQSPTNGAAISGSTYLHWTTDLVASSSSAVSISAGATGYAVNGYTTFSSGIVQQWGGVGVAGHDTAFTITWPIAFGTQVYVVNFWVYNDSGSLAELVGVANTGGATPTGFSGQLIGGTAGDNYTVSFIVIGI